MVYQKPKALNQTNEHLQVKLIGQKVPLPSLQLNFGSLAKCLAVGLCICFHKLLDNQGYELAHSNIHLIYELLEQVKEMSLQIQNSRISMTQGNNSISKKSPSESPSLENSQSQARSSDRVGPVFCRPLVVPGFYRLLKVIFSDEFCFFCIAKQRLCHNRDGNTKEQAIQEKKLNELIQDRCFMHILMPNQPMCHKAMVLLDSPMGNILEINFEIRAGILSLCCDEPNSTKYYMN
ncbi:hypothetical protein STEG23_003715 [Scotinomys teguina]